MARQGGKQPQHRISRAQRRQRRSARKCRMQHSTGAPKGRGWEHKARLPMHQIFETSRSSTAPMSTPRRKESGRCESCDHPAADSSKLSAIPASTFVAPGRGIRSRNLGGRSAAPHVPEVLTIARRPMGGRRSTGDSDRPAPGGSHWPKAPPTLFRFEGGALPAVLKSWRGRRRAVFGGHHPCLRRRQR